MRTRTGFRNPRRAIRAAALGLLLGLAVSAVLGAEATPAVLSIGVTVSDLDASVEFFTTVLDFDKVSEEERSGEAWERLTGVFGARSRVAELRVGEERVVLTEYLTPHGRPVPVDSRSNDRWFQHMAIVVSDMDAAYARLRAHHVRHVSTGPQLLPDWNPNAGGIRAFYFQDADRHNLEVIAYPPGKGDPRWQDKSRLFLGIDHTAIVVGDTEASLAFYRDALALHVAGTSENWGTEQEHLNQVFGARLRITALRGVAGPGIELLEYLSPSDGRPAPEDLAASDLVHWQVAVAVADVDASRAAALGAGGRAVSAGVVEGPAETAIRNRKTLVRDPEGHALGLIGR